ncbi:MAG: hypothetical protein ABN482_06200 [Corticimicrobacter sp.]|uniref:hypothetical protein n=1 Tax=Corticimicrobacter sp. TaxID=2678536 RepID=UPI0032DA76FC
MHARLARPAYVASLRATGISTSFVQAFLGEPGFENALFSSFWNQERAHPWPPCFIPLLKYRHGMEAYGALLHPLHPERPLTFVRLMLEEGYVVEVARNEVQFLDLIALESSISSHEDIQLDPAAVNLLRVSGSADHLAHIRAAAEFTGILEEGLVGKVPGFVPDWPLACYEYQGIDSYTGHFPVSVASQPACPYERDFLFAAELAERMDEPATVPRTPAEQWMALQASGTSIAVAREILKKLQADCDHSLLSAWLLAADKAEGNF